MECDQTSLINIDTKGTDPGVCVIEVSILCASIKYSHTHPKVIRNSEREAKIFQGKYEAKLEIPEGWKGYVGGGGGEKGMEIFLNNTL